MRKMSQERQLEEYWNKHYKNDNAFKGVVPDQMYKLKASATFAAPSTEILWKEVKSLICEKVVEGNPLARDEYYIALACGFLMGDRPYMEFFKTRWHETDTHKGYCSAKECLECIEAKSKLKKAI